jgi:hypothetical protein
VYLQLKPGSQSPYTAFRVRYPVSVVLGDGEDVNPFDRLWVEAVEVEVPESGY